MPPHIHTTGRLVLAIVLAGALLPASALAQAGITGDAMGPKFDGTKSLQSKSALGQLEELTGSTVDRSSSQSSYRSTVTRVAPQPGLAQPRYDPNQQIAGALAGAMVGMLFDSIFSDNSAQEQAAAQAAAAQAAAEAEAFRLQQEAARVARVRMAQHYRAEWDAREAEIGNRLGGAFDVTTGTALFGRPANPDADTVAAILGQDIGGAEQAPGEIPDVYGSDPSVVDLRGSSLVVPLLRQPTPAVTHGRGATRAPATTSWVYDWPDSNEGVSAVQSQRAVPSMKNAIFFNDWYAGSLTNIATETLFGLIPEYVSRFPLRGLVTTISGFKDDYESIWNPLKIKAVEIVGAISSGSQQVLTTMGNPYGGDPEAGSSYDQSVNSIGDETQSWAKYKALDIFSSKVLSSPDLNEVMKTPVGDSNVMPLHNVPVYPDYARLLFGSRG
jgi:hypothetical protein